MVKHFKFLCTRAYNSSWKGVVMARKLLPGHKGVIQTIFLGKDDQTVNVVESQHIDFEEILACLKLGGSVFITSK